MRLFIAVDLNDSARKNISDIISRLKKKDFDVKWVNPENIHITLKFLGEVNENDMKGLENIISGSVKDVKKFKINISKAGYFGKGNYVKVVWVDIREGRDILVQLSRKFNKELTHIRREEREPSPHITIGRVRSGRNVHELINEVEGLSDVKVGEVEVNDIKLKQSVLKPDGPIYIDLKTFELQ